MKEEIQTAQHSVVGGICKQNTFLLSSERATRLGLTEKTEREGKCENNAKRKNVRDRKRRREALKTASRKKTKQDTRDTQRESHEWLKKQKVMKKIAQESKREVEIEIEKERERERKMNR